MRRTTGICQVGTEVCVYALPDIIGNSFCTCFLDPDFCRNRQYLPHSWIYPVSKYSRCMLSSDGAAVCQIVSRRQTPAVFFLAVQKGKVPGMIISVVCANMLKHSRRNSFSTSPKSFVSSKVSFIRIL